MRIAFFIAILFLLAAQANAQDGPEVIIEGRITNFITQANLSGVSIEVFKDGALVETKKTSNNGKYKLKPLELQHKYKIVISSAGMVPRYFEVDLTKVPSNLEEENGWEIPTDIPLVERKENVDFSPLEPKRTSILQFTSNGSLDWNYNEITWYRTELTKLLAKAEKTKTTKEDPKNTTSTSTANVNASTNTTTSTSTTSTSTSVNASTTTTTTTSSNTAAVTTANNLVVEAQNAYSKGDYATAIKKYNEAIAANPAIQSEVQVKLEKAQTDYKKFEADKKLEAEYNDFMTQGNAKLSGKEYDNAIAFYTQALQRKPNDAIANAKIEEAKRLKESEKPVVTTTSNNTNTNTNNTTSVKATTTTNTTNNSSVTNTNVTTNTTSTVISPVKNNANPSLTTSTTTTTNKGNNPTTTANTVKGTTTTTTSTKTTNNPATTTSSTNKTATVNTPPSGKSSYQVAMDNGNAELSAGNFEKSIAHFNKALEAKPNDANATKQKNRAQELWDQDKETKREMYLQIVKKADELFVNKNYPEAKALYERAVKFNKTDEHPQNRIKECIAMMNPKKEEPVPPVTLQPKKTDPNYAETEAKRAMELLRRKMEYERNMDLMSLKDQDAYFWSTKTSEDKQRSYTDQELLNYQLYNRTNFYKDKSEFRKTKVNATQQYIDDLRDNYRKKNQEYAKATYDHHQYLNDNKFDLNAVIKGKDYYRQKSIGQVKTRLDNDVDFLRSRKDYGKGLTGNNNNMFKANGDAENAFARKANGNYLDNAEYFKTINDKNNSDNNQFKASGSEQTKSNNAAITAAPPIPKTYTTEALDKLAKDFGEGVHQWTTEKTSPDLIVYETIIRRLVVHGGVANDYVMTQNRWGSFYTKNGKTIVEHTWQLETAGEIKEYSQK